MYKVEISNVLAVLLDRVKKKLLKEKGLKIEPFVWHLLCQCLKMSSNVVIQVAMHWTAKKKEVGKWDAENTKDNFCKPHISACRSFFPDFFILVGGNLKDHG